MKTDTFFFKPRGFLRLEFDREDMIPIEDEINKIKDEKIISKEDTYHEIHCNVFNLNLCKEHVNKLIIPCVDEYVNNFGFPYAYHDIMTRNAPFTVSNLWVNFQKKFEFNPLHDHPGVFGFVIWIKLPYGEEEKTFFDYENGTKSAKNGCIEFYNVDSWNIECCRIFTDKFFEGKGVLFPSYLSHAVYPFYTSDEYRISVGGNVKFEV
jgi:hypothetical protein